MNGYEFPVTLTIEEYFLSDPNEDQTRRNNFEESIIDETGGHSVQPVECKTLEKIKKLSSDSSKGYFIIVADVATLHRFLDDDYQIVIPDARATYWLHFVFTSWESCEDVKYELSDILRRFWMDYNVVNVIAQTPCSCDSQKVYIYRPFIKTNSSWGSTNVYTLQEINNNHRLITNYLDNLNRVPLPIAVFPNYLTAFRDLPKLLDTNPIYKNLTWSKGFVGKDGMILGTLAESLNFDMVLIGNKEKNFGMMGLDLQKFLPDDLVPDKLDVYRVYNILVLDEIFRKCSKSVVDHVFNIPRSTYSGGTKFWPIFLFDCLYDL
ncbi:hypothetical protein GEV33_000637 [Tenebrio molitor]|uniref:Uncharacterized protein n=1 Tax=Tenebrio molitor TaxID=7067 RepID=A0A8J6HWS5_TENMO|nr:hypothetical protein GEV33_000637 [Tenebrio molitor]